MVLAGTLFNTFFFLMFMLVSWIQVKAHCCTSFPGILSKSLAWFGVGTLLDPLLIFIVDLIIGNTDGDMYKMYNYYDR